jgi:hypothetical protein
MNKIDILVNILHYITLLSIRYIITQSVVQNRSRISWNRIPDEIRAKVIERALDAP